MDRRLFIFIGIGLAVTLVIAGIVSGFASSEPDGLERVAADQGFDEAADDHAFADGPLADYTVDGVDNDRVGTGLAGVIGALITLVVMIGLLYGVRAFCRRGEDRMRAPT